MAALRLANLALRFALELAALAAVAVWGWQAADGVVRWLLVVAAPLAVAVVWGLFVSPKATVKLPRLGAFAVELGVWALATAALAASGHGAVAVAFAVVALVSGTLNLVSE